MAPLRWIGLILLASHLAAVPAGAQSLERTSDSRADPASRKPLRELSTDRPDKTESPYTVDAGYLQIELDLATYSRDVYRSAGADVRMETARIAPFNLKLGLTDRTDAQLLVDPYVRQILIDDVSGVRRRAAGFGDVTVRIKHNLWGNDGGGTAFALMPFVTFPTSRQSHLATFGLIAPLAIRVTDRVGIGLMTEFDLAERSDGSGYAATFVNSATLSTDLSDRLGAYAELFTERSSDDGARWVVTADIGVTYAVTGDLQLDGGVNLGLTEAADDLEVFVGISRRF